MAVSTGPAPFGLSGWTYEKKRNGWRAFALIEPGRYQLVSGNGGDLTALFPEFRTFPSLVRGAVLLDGVIVAGRGTVADSTRLMRQDAMRFFVAFDLLAVDGCAIVDQPLENRRASMRERIHDHMRLTFSRSNEDGPALFDRAITAGYEGVIAKRLGSVYRPGELSRDWIEVLK
jgi:bifunctional non-homologous end joining protein LigD